ncbi:putative MFS family arabinose efflux permease [Sulfuritortus calidifontis]|uniref:Putative MFS family arabinose efflux permease n=1 Tax=Sulfuritortus calidifontis TaxID=1914471 RepID=A0A4R3JX14_9PROT|nr:MFS transporter [Sulfuritortus calidifontis]TCS72769.1 putative MFS family arabinose efflux permease [Sulfuritortus calidifontis]
MSDRRLIYLASFLRAIATGLIGVLLGLYLARLAFSPAEIGLTVSAGLAGATLAVFLVGLRGDRWGRRRTLIQLAWLAAAGGLGALLFSELAAILLAAFVGMLNGQGRDRGASLVLEQAILPATTSDAERTRAFAWYNVLQDVGHALGSALAALPTWLHDMGGLPDLAGFKLALGLYVLLFAAQAMLFARLSPRIEQALSEKAMPLSPDSRRRLTRISALFAIDALAGGFLGAALIAYFFHARFGVDAQSIAALFVGARALNAASHLGAAWLARRIGLVNTMVFTHIPSSLLLMTVAVAPDFTTAAILFLLREGLVEMDVPTRQSYVMAMVKPEERTFASGVTHLVRLGGWAVAPAFAGLLMQGLSLGAPLLVGAAIKIGYDGLLWAGFRRIRPPEEHISS